MTERFIHGGNVYDEPTNGAWLDFSANINPLGLSRAVKQTLLNCLPRIVCYPDPAARRLKQAIADFYRVPPECIVLGNGATELFYLLFFVLRPKATIIPAPTFAEYERAALAANAAPIFLPLDETDNFAIGEQFAASVKRQCADAAVVLGNPNNPTGTLVEPDMRERLLRMSQDEGAWLIVDESFLDFLGHNGEALSFMPYCQKCSRLIVVRSMTKFFALPGLRLGFAVVAPELAAKLNAAKDVWNVNLLAQAAGVAALADTDYIADTVKFVAVEKDFLAAELAKIAALKVFPPTVNFILAKLSGEYSAAAIVAQMRTRGILVRDCGNYRGLNGEFIRMAVRTRAENMRLVAELRNVCEGEQ